MVREVVKGKSKANPISGGQGVVRGDRNRRNRRDSCTSLTSASRHFSDFSHFSHFSDLSDSGSGALRAPDFPLEYVVSQGEYHGFRPGSRRARGTLGVLGPRPRVPPVFAKLSRIPAPPPHLAHQVGQPGNRTRVRFPGWPTWWARWGGGAGIRESFAKTGGTRGRGPKTPRVPLARRDPGRNP